MKNPFKPCAEFYRRLMAREFEAVFRFAVIFYGCLIIIAICKAIESINEYIF